jgi:Tol biopolymer transport system component
VFGSSLNRHQKPTRSASPALSISIAALVALAACGPAASPSATTGFGPSASATGGFGASPTVATRAPEASGGKVPLILFTRSRAKNEDVTFTIGIDGSQETELTDVQDCCGTWSPDGTIIVVPDGPAESRVLPATVNPDGTSYVVHRIGPPTLNLAPGGWSPDGTKTMFEAWDDTDPSRTGIYVSEGFSLADAVPVQITHAKRHDVGLGWSPEGARLLLIQVARCPDSDCDGGDLYVVDSDGSDLIRLSPKGTFVSCCGPASWSPDGTHVAFAGLSLDATGLRDELKSAVYVATADGSDVAAITEPGAFTETAAWSPDGEWIVFNKKSGPVGVKGSDLYLVHPDGSGLHPITTGGAAGKSDQFAAAWSPDGRRLLFDSVPGGPVKRGDLWMVNVDGTGLIQLTDARAPVAGYSWQPLK